MTMRETREALEAIERAYDALLDMPYRASRSNAIQEVFDRFDAETERLSGLLRNMELAAYAKTA